MKVKLLNFLLFIILYEFYEFIVKNQSYKNNE